MSELRKLQLVELDILKEFIKVCDKLNLKYYLDSGTLLGCIRHEGFIPWDDDIDIGMFREDYDVFIQKGQELLPEGLFIQTYKTDKEYVQAFAKIRNSNTTFIETSAKNQKINHGVYIDIFPFDNYAKEKKITNFIDHKKDILYNIQLNKKYFLNHLGKPKGFKVRITKAISELFFKNKPIYDLLEMKVKLATKYNKRDCEFVKCYFYSTTINTIFHKSIFGNGVKKKFEDIYVNVPERYDEYLKVMYGDYMKLPPEEKRIAHHYNEKIDLKKSYKEYIN